MTIKISSKKSIFSYIALIFGMISFLAVVVNFYLPSIEPEPPVEKTVAMAVVGVTKYIIKESFHKHKTSDISQNPTKDEPQDLEPASTFWVVNFVASMMALFAIFMGIIGFIRKESKRVLIAAFVFASGTFLFQYFVFLLVLLFFIALVSCISF